MSQTGKNNNMKVAPLRVSQLLPELLAMQENEEEDYGSESDGEYPDRSFSDGEVIDHNRGFYRSSFKTDLTHPISNRSLKEQNGDCAADENFYNQTYPNKESQSASKNKSKVISTPLKINKHNSILKHVTNSGRSVRATPHSSNKKNKTPRYMKGLPSSSCKSSAKKKETPFRKCLNLDDAFKGTTKASLFSTSKANPTPGRHTSQTTSKETAGDKKEIKCDVKATPLDEIFASAMQITDDRKEGNIGEHERDVSGAQHAEKMNPFGSKHNQKSYNMFATPKTSVTSNSIIKGCRDNFVTPLKPSDISGINKHETPCTQNKSIFKSQQTPLFTIKEKGDAGTMQSHKKVESSISKSNCNISNNKENIMDVQHKKSLFRETNESHDRIEVLKEVHVNDSKTPLVNKQYNATSHDNQKKIIAESNFRQLDNKIVKSHHDQNDGRPHFFHHSNQQQQKAQSYNLDNKENAQSKNYFERFDPIVNRESQHFPTNNRQPVFDVKSQQSRLSNDDLNNQRNRPSMEQARPMFDQRIANQNQQIDQNILSIESTLQNQQKMDAMRCVSQQQQQQQQQQTTTIPRQFKTLTIKGKQYIVLGSLGSGGSSEVFKVMDPEDSSMYAVKCVNLSVEHSVAQSYVNEIKLLQRLQGSDRVITMYDYEYVEKKRMLYVVLEMGDVDLSRLMKGYRARESRLPLPILVCYWTEMLTAVRHIHQNGIIHSDLKPANFLLVHGRLKLIDFGIASSLNADATSVLKESTTGTFNYISPEALNAGSEGRDPIKISYKSDVWSLGCILYSMLYGRTPFSHVTHIMAKIRALCNPDQVIHYPEIQGLPAVLMQALRWCLTYDIKQRPSVQQLIELPYMGEGTVQRPLGEADARRKLPIKIMMKIKEALTQEELNQVIEALDGK